MCEMLFAWTLDLAALIAAGKRPTARGRKGMGITVNTRLETDVCTVRSVSFPWNCRSKHAAG